MTNPIDEISNWMFRYDTKSKQWIGFDCKDVDIFVNEKFSHILKSSDIQDLILDILVLKQKKRDG